jgi:hypothetical protein
MTVPTGGTIPSENNYREHVERWAFLRVLEAERREVDPRGREVAPFNGEAGGGYGLRAGDHRLFCFGGGGVFSEADAARPKRKRLAHGKCRLFFEGIFSGSRCFSRLGKGFLKAGCHTTGAVPASLLTSVEGFIESVKS